MDPATITIISELWKLGGLPLVVVVVAIVFGKRYFAREDKHEAARAQREERMLAAVENVVNATGEAAKNCETASRRCYEVVNAALVIHDKADRAREDMNEARAAMEASNNNGHRRVP